MVKPSGHIDWSIEDLSRALKINAADVREYFTDGRRISFILGRRLAHEILGGKLAETEGAGYDLIDQRRRRSPY